MVSKTEMLKVIPRVKLASAIKKKRKKVPMSWNKEKIAEQLSFDELRKLYGSVKVKPARKKVVKKKVKRKVVKKKPARKKVVKKKVKRTVVKKKPARKKVAKKRR